MYTPHTVTVYNRAGSEMNITILRGVFLDISQGGNLMRSGLTDISAVYLYIPMSIKAVNALTGQEQEHLPPKEYARAEDKAAYWTIGERGKGSGNDCFFVKGEVVEPYSSYNDLNDQYDYCYRVSTVDVRDFGSPNMQHWQVGGK